jgi:hypothetical protein
MNEKSAWLKNIFPWEQRTLRVNGRSMAYVDEGDAEARPLLLLHGNPTWGFLYRDFVGPPSDKEVFSTLSGGTRSGGAMGVLKQKS